MGIAAHLEDTSVEQVTEALELALVLGRFRPRERLVEDELIRDFGAKRHVVRSALVALERKGLVERPPNRGAIVKDYTLEEVEEIYKFRSDLHRLAVTHMPLPLSDTVVERLQERADAHEAAIANGDLTTVIRENNAFHDLLFDQCGNRYLAETIQQFGVASHAIRSYRIGDPDLLAQAAREHREMIEAAHAGDRAKLLTLCEQHILPSKQLYLNDREHSAILQSIR